MVAATAIFAFLAVIGSTWWFGLWNNVLNLVNFFIASLVASSFYENVAASLFGSMATYDYILDFVALWLVFFFTFGVLRGLTEVLSSVRLKFHPIVDMAARSFVCLWLATAFMFFTVFSMHLAPIAPSDAELQAFDSEQSLEQVIAGTDPGTKFFSFGPGRMWMSFIQSRSRGALSASVNEPLLPEYSLPQHPDDQAIDARVFDPFSRMPVVRQRVRVLLSKTDGLRVE